MTGKLDEAYDAFYKATWSYETQSSGFYWLAALSCRRGNYKDALKFIDESMIRNWHNMKARTLKAVILRTLGQDSNAFLEESKRIDPLDMGIRLEISIVSSDSDNWKRTMREPLTITWSWLLITQKQDSTKMLYIFSAPAIPNLL